MYYCCVIKFFPFHLCGYITGGHSSVVEHPTADRIVPGSNPGAHLV